MFFSCATAVCDGRNMYFVPKAVAKGFPTEVASGFYLNKLNRVINIVYD